MLHELLTQVWFVVVVAIVITVVITVIGIVIIMYYPHARDEANDKERILQLIQSREENYTFRSTEGIAESLHLPKKYVARFWEKLKILSEIILLK